MGDEPPPAGPSQWQSPPPPGSSRPPPLMFYDAASVLCAPVTPQQVISFNPRERGQPSRVMPDGSEYYGDLLLDEPHGLGIMLFKSSSSLHSNGDRYGGGWKNGLFHGDGIFVTSSFTYQGGWLDGQMHGKGQMTYSRRITDFVLRGISVFSPFDKTHAPLEYRGDFHYRYHRHGHGVMRYANGDTYNGEWGSNRRHGHGRLVTADGEVYEGQWSKDERHGNGKITYVNGGEFRGSMVSDRRHGEGVMMFPNGDEYYGTFQNDKIEGHGTMRYKNGDVYEGMWKDGLRNGEGKYSLRKKGATVEGRFVNGLIQGRGVVRHPGVSTFVGEFDRGERRHGTLFWHDSYPGGGACYQGEWLGETMHNRGLLWYRNGDFYFGRFVKNKRHGPGNIRYADGGEYSGYFVNDLREGQGILQNANGSIQAGMWHNDVFIEGYDGEWDGVTFNGIGHLLLSKPPPCVPAGGSNGAATPSVGNSGGDTSPTAAATSATAAALTGMQPLFEHFGLFLHGVRHGAGVLRLAGHVVMGIWKHDALSCETGSWEFPSGDVYVGGFQNGLREGPKGQMWFTDGSFFTGNWRFDVPVGNGAFYATDKREPIYAPEEGAADATPPACAEGDGTHGGNYSGVMGLFISLFRRKASPENKDTRRAIGFREHFVLQGEWGILRLSYAMYQSLMARLNSNATLAVTGDGGSGGGGGSNSGGGAVGAPPPGSSSGGGAHALFKHPAMIPVGMQERQGFVVFKSGICMRTEWLHNHPRLMLPHRPDAPLYNKIRGVVVTNDKGGAEGSKLCSFCEKPFTFFRKETQCTLCEQRSCSSCLHPIEVRGRPKIEALVRLRMGHSVSNSDGNSNSSNSNSNNASAGDMFVLPAQVPACGDCARAAMLSLEFNVIWIPMHCLSVSETGTVSDASADDHDEKTGAAPATASYMEAFDRAETSLLKSSSFSSSSSFRPKTPYVVYEGYTCNCIPHIYGSLWWGKQGYYLGAFHEGRRHGRGVQMLANGEKYVGEFSNDEWHGMGIYCADDGSVYEGVWEHGTLTSLHYHGEMDEQYRRHGRGQSYEVDGGCYNGEWQRGQRHGTGILQMKDNVVYSGDFAFGRIEGEGKLLMETSVFYGSFHAGKKQGKGVEHFGDCVIEGKWCDDVLSGFVRIYDALTETVYETTYQNGNERDDCFVPPVMVDDAHCQSCAQCHATFSLFLRRHHCRLCGEVVCDGCSQRRASMPLHFKPNGPSRVCDRCYRRMEERRMLGIRRYKNGELYAGCWTRGRWVSRGLFRRTDGSIVVMDLAGCPLVNGEGTAPAANTDAAQDLPLDASPPAEELRRLSPSSQTEVDAFTLWWSMMLSVAELSLPLELTPCESFTLPRAPPMKPLRLFLEKDGANDEDGGGGGDGDYDDRNAAAVRAARYIPSIAPPAPEPPARLSDDSVLTSSPPPRPVITDSHIMRLMTDGRMEMFPTVPPPSPDGNGVVMLSCYQRGPLLPPTPPRPPPGKNERIMWDSWQTRPVPQYHGTLEPNTQRVVAEWQHMPFACPFLRPVVNDVDRAVRGGGATRWLPTPLVGPQAFTVTNTNDGRVLVEQKEGSSSNGS